MYLASAQSRCSLRRTALPKEALVVEDSSNRVPAARSIVYLLSVDVQLRITLYGGAEPPPATPDGTTMRKR